MEQAIYFTEKSFRIQPRHAGAMNYSAWLSLLLLGVMIGRVTIAARGREDYAGIDLAAFVEIIITLLLFGIFYLSPTAHRCIAVYRQSSLKYFFIFLGFGAISSFWSVNPAYSAFRAIQDMAILFSVGMILLDGTSHEIMQRRFYLIGILVIVFDVLRKMLRFSNYGHVSTHDVLLGSSAAILFGYTLGCFLGKSIDRIGKIMFVIATIILLATTSAGASVSVLVGFILVSVLVHKANYLIYLAFFLLVFLLLYSVFGSEAIKSAIFFGKDEGAIATGSGRTTIWAYYIQMILKKPILGYGFAVGSRVCEDFYASNSHNTYLGAALGTGLGGVFLLILYFLKSFQSAIESAKIEKSHGLGLALGISIIAINNLTNAYAGESWYTTTVLFSAFAHLLAYQEYSSRDRKPRRIIIRREMPNANL